MAEMALVPSIYRLYSTNIRRDFEKAAPGITSRFEIFTDESFAEMEVSTPDSLLVEGTTHLD